MRDPPTAHLPSLSHRLARREALENLASQVLIEIFQDFRGALGGERAKQIRHPLARQSFGDVSEVGGVNLLGFGSDARRIVVEQVEDVRREQCGNSPDFVLARGRVQGGMPLVLHHTTGRARRSSRKCYTSYPAMDMASRMA